MRSKPGKKVASASPDRESVAVGRPDLEDEERGRSDDEADASDPPGGGRESSRASVPRVASGKRNKVSQDDDLVDSPIPRKPKKSSARRSPGSDDRKPAATSSTKKKSALKKAALKPPPPEEPEEEPPEDLEDEQPEDSDDEPYPPPYHSDTSDVEILGVTKGKRKSDSRAKDAGATSRPVRGSRADSAAGARRSVDSATGQDERPNRAAVRDDAAVAQRVANSATGQNARPRRAAASRLNRAYQLIIEQVVDDTSHDLPSMDRQREIGAYCMALSRIGFDRSAIAALFQQGLSSHKDLLSKDYEQINAVVTQIGKDKDRLAVLPATSVEFLIAL